MALESAGAPRAPFISQRVRKGIILQSVESQSFSFNSNYSYNPRTPAPLHSRLIERTDNKMRINNPPSAVTHYWPIVQAPRPRRAHSTNHRPG